MQITVRDLIAEKNRNSNFVLCMCTSCAPTLLRFDQSDVTETSSEKNPLRQQLKDHE